MVTSHNILSDIEMSEIYENKQLTVLWAENPIYIHHLVTEIRKHQSNQTLILICRFHVYTETEWNSPNIETTTKLFHFTFVSATTLICYQGYLRELALAISFVSLGSNQTLFLPHFITADASRFWRRSVLKIEK